MEGTSGGKERPGEIGEAVRWAAEERGEFHLG